MIEFRDYQQKIIDDGVKIISEKGFLYLAMEVRTGKTLTSLGIAEKMGYENVLFLTKKKAISSITHDNDMMCPTSFISNRAVMILKYGRMACICFPNSCSNLSIHRSTQ